MTTAMQVASRLFLVWAVNDVIPEIHTHWSFSTMVIAWSIAECVRYIFYVFHLSGGEVPKVIMWARYNFFLVLYPVGVFSEMTMVYQALPYAKAISPLYYYGLIVVALIYIPGNGYYSIFSSSKFLNSNCMCRISRFVFSHVDST